MASTTWPSTAGSRIVDDLQYEALGAGWSSDGILGTAADTTTVFGDSSGRQVKFRANKTAIVRGHGWSSGTSDVIKTVAVNNTSQTRLDLAVLGLDRTTWAVTEYLKTGTAGSGNPPSLQRDALGSSATGKWEIPVAVVTVRSGASTIAASDVASVAPYLLPAQMIYVASVASLALIPSAPSGQMAWVAGSTNQLYTYVPGSGAGTGWRRQDWNSEWGVVGGRLYPNTGSNLTGQIVFGLSNLGMSTGSVPTIAGRTYRLRARFRTRLDNASAQTHTFIHTGADGKNYGFWTSYTRGQDTDYFDELVGEYDETVTGTRSWDLKGYKWTGDGSFTLYRGASGDPWKCCYVVEDIGPTTTLSVGA